MGLKGIITFIASITDSTDYVAVYRDGCLVAEGKHVSAEKLASSLGYEVRFKNVCHKTMEAIREEGAPPKLEQLATIGKKENGRNEEEATGYGLRHQRPDDKGNLGAGC